MAAVRYEMADETYGMRVNVTIPVYNEAATLEVNVRKVHKFLTSNFGSDFEIVVADNGSTDASFPIAARLEGTLSQTRSVRLERKGRGGALRESWTSSGADLLTYMDEDLSTDLSAFLPLTNALAADGFDLAIGSRVLSPQLVKRGIRRELISRCYNLLVKTLCGVCFTDAQCGFKGIRAEAARVLLPLVDDDEWFFDTELLILAEKLGYRICDCAIQWTDDPTSSVKIAETAWKQLRGLIRVRKKVASLGFLGRYRCSCE
jgi:glycosyltransferase involved in cell wall biosynthesis